MKIIDYSVTDTGTVSFTVETGPNLTPIQVARLVEGVAAFVSDWAIEPDTHAADPMRVSRDTSHNTEAVAHGAGAGAPSGEGGPKGANSRRRAADKEAKAEVEADPTPEPEASTRRRRSSSTDAAQPAAEVAGPADGADTQPAPSSRRRTSSVEEPVRADPVEGASMPAPGRRRRSSEAGADAAPGPTSAPSPEPAQPAGRRRSATPSGSAPAPGQNSATEGRPEPEGGYTDADMSRACSQAAPIITPAAVTAYLKTFGVPSSQNVPKPRRKEFIDGLDLLVAQAKKAG